MKKFLWPLLALTLSSPALAVSVGIPTQEMGVPPVDLLYNGREIDRDQAIDLSNGGLDLSTLQPQNSDAWTNEELPLSNASQWNYPQEGSALSFDSYMDSTERVMRSRVIQGSGISSQPFQLLISLNDHRAMTTAALLRKLGYPIASPQHYNTLTVTFADNAARDEFLNNLADKNQACRGRWLKYDAQNAIEAAAIAKDPCARKDYIEHSAAFLNRPEVTLQDVVLEPAQIDTWMFHWGVMRAQLLKGRRSLRALLVPTVLADVQESVNLFPWEFGRLQNNYLILTHPYADQWQEATFSDLKWIARKISVLTRSDLQAIVAAGQYPDDVSALLVEKMVARQKQLAEVFSVQGPMRYDFDSRIDIGAIKRGKATQQWYPGFAGRFAYDDPQSPLRADEIGRYFLINSLASGVGKLVEQVNHLLEVQNVADIAQSHIGDLRNQCIAEFNQHGFCTRPMGVWGGPVAGASLTADRSVITGNLYGGESKVQLVDNLGVSAMVGFFATKDGLPTIGGAGIQVGLLANMTVQRNYVHVRPVASMRDALRNNWGNLYVPKFMSKLANSLDPEINPSPSASPSPSGGASDGTAAASTSGTFLDELKEGEMFIVTDSVAVGAKAQVGLPLAAILDVGIMGLSPRISISAGAQRAILRRTTITRTSTGLQVYLQRVNSSSVDFTFDVNFWINVFKFSASGKHSTAEAKAFLLGNVADADRKKVAIALKALLKSNNSEILEGDFAFYALSHDMTSRVQQGSFLRWQWYSLDESHEVKIQPPRDAVAGSTINPRDFERTLFSHRLVRTNGSNDSMLLSSVINRLAPGWNVLPNSGVNPANSFLGKGQWGVWETEGEVTPGHVSSPVTTVEHHWGGWKLARDKLLQILDGVENKTRDLNLNIPTIRRDEFMTLRELQFYEITQKLIIYQKGMDNLQNTFFPADLSTFAEYANKDLLKRLRAVEYSDGSMNDRKFVDYCQGQGISYQAPDFASMFHPRELGFGFSNGPTSLPTWSEDSLWYPKDAFGNHNDFDDRNYYCVKPWMKYFLDNRTKVPTDPRDKIKWQANLMRQLETTLPLNKLLAIVGRDNYFYQVKVTGFSDVDASINNENGIVDYLSDSIGTASEQDGGGIFSDFANQTGITGYELNGRYMSEGM